MAEIFGGMDLRTTLHSAFGLVRSIEANRSAGAFTLDHAISEQISFLKRDASRDVVDNRGASSGRPSRYDRLERLSQMLELTISTVKDAGDDVSRLQAIGIYEAKVGE